jgi:hypothetical protein
MFCIEAGVTITLLPAVMVVDDVVATLFPMAAAVA